MINSVMAGFRFLIYVSALFIFGFGCKSNQVYDFSELYTHKYSNKYSRYWVCINCEKSLEKAKIHENESRNDLEKCFDNANEHFVSQDAIKYRSSVLSCMGEKNWMMVEEKIIVIED